MFGGTPELRGVAHWRIHGAQFVAIGVGILLLAGLWTPIAGALEAIIEIWIISGQRDDPSVHYLLAALAVSLVMLGPGAWSVDARLFGRKRIDIRRRLGSS
jgi:uncharacterized membrane protein YphA (DoxX/SURF4 family)